MPAKPSPFPGMDPYLERRWGNSHALLIAHTAEQLNLRLPDDLSAEIEEYVHIDAMDDDAPQRSRRPDVFVIEDPLPRTERFTPEVGTAVASVPILLPMPGPFTERWIHIMDDDGNRVVTAIEFLSPWNKKPGRGREAYLEKRQQVLASPTHLVEVDLVRSGDWVGMTDPYEVPAEYWTTYRAAVYRRTPDGQRPASWYPIRLSDRLPTVNVPLRPREADVPLDLQAVVDEVYRRGAGRRIDYARPCNPPLADREAAWADALLKAAGRR
jgi:hypothetical protein